MSGFRTLHLARRLGFVAGLCCLGSNLSAPAQAGQGEIQVPEVLSDSSFGRPGTALLPLEDSVNGPPSGRFLVSAPLESRIARFVRAEAVPGLAQEFMGRMEREARRSHSSQAIGFEDLTTLGEPDLDALRSREAQRIVTRAVNRTLDSQVDALGRSTPGLRSVISWLEGLGQPRDARSTEPIGLVEGAAAAGAGNVTPRFTARWGLKIDSHPRLVLASRSARFQGRLELPLLNEPMRFSLERSFGARQRAVLTSGLDRDGHGWASLGLFLSF